jgi:hypothetical protein
MGTLTGTPIGTLMGALKGTYMGTDIGTTKRNQMRIGHQIFCYLQDWTDAGHYDVQQVFFFMDSSQRKLCVKSLFINEEENQVYLVLEDETGNSFQMNVHGFICMMGGPVPQSYQPLYQIRDELQIYRKRIVKSYKVARREAIKKLKENANHLINIKI